VATKQIYTNKKITVITTHINADFDAVASMLAAQKLYPGSVVVFPGSHEKSLRNFFISSMVYLFNMVDINDIDFSKIKRLVIVDTKQPSRIGKLASLVNRPDMEIHIYDHHPSKADDIKPDYEISRPTGSTVTILTEILRKKGIDISADEATIMCLGIYEDTGSFTFSSTVEKDFIAAGFLLSKGANLNTISNLISREISPQQIALLNDMLQSATHYEIKGVDVVVSAISTEQYVSDFAFLVQKMFKMENLNALFVIARMGSKIHIIARSRVPEADVGAILIPLGGGGHAFAASANIKNMTLAQTQEKLMDALSKKIKPTKLAKDLMSSPPITIKPDVSCKDAGSLLTRYNINAVLVTERTDGKDKLTGFISRQIIGKALYHMLKDVPVREYMTTEFASVGPDADIPEIQEKIILNKQRILPVIDKGRIRGVITRTDLLNFLVSRDQEKTGELPPRLDETSQARTRDIAGLMKERLSERIINILKTIGIAATQSGYGVYVVGGFVRDLFLSRKNEDIDIVIEGDGIDFAKNYATMTGAHVHCHEKFGTAVIKFPDGFKVDVASARLEYYKFPAALPTVEMSSIKLDLFRRDFTINTLAIAIDPDRFGMLIDFFSAQRDIKEKVIRILHNLSFVEDPTRAFRAIRFEQRFDFSIGKLTSGLIKNAVKMDFFKQLSGFRVFNELRQILEEENPTPAIIRLSDYDLLAVIHPSIKLDNRLVSMLNSVKKVLSWHDLLFLEESYMKWVVYFMVLIRLCNKKTSEMICGRFEIQPRYRKYFCKGRFKADSCIAWLEKNLQINNSTLYRQLSGFKTELILYMMATTKEEEAKKLISHYFIQLRRIKTLVSGDDLKKMGLEPGPIYGEILQAVLDAKLNGQLKTKKDELVLVHNYVSKL